MFNKAALGIFLVGLLGLGSPVNSVRVNITNFQNCELDPNENLVQLVSLTDIWYEFDADGFCDTVHAKVKINKANNADKLLNITMMRCAADTTGTCNDNVEHFYDTLNCDRFKMDETGPWFMLSKALSGSHCGEKEGEFEINNAKLKLSYLTNYMVHDVDFPRHRMIHVLRKNLEGFDEPPLRFCLDMEFTLVFD